MRWGPLVSVLNIERQGSAAWRYGREGLIAILLAGATLRILLTFFAGAGHIKADSRYYLTMADAILAGAPISDFPNGLPLIIAAMKLAVGADHLITALLILNVVLSMLTVVLVYAIFVRIFQRGEAVLAAALVAFLPNQINYVPQIMSEVPCAFALVLATWLFVSGRFAAAGAVFYATAMIRTTLLPVGMLLVAGLLFSRRWRDAAMLSAGLGAGLVFDQVLQWHGVIVAPSNLALNLLVSISNTSSAGINFSIDHFTADERAHPLATHLKFMLANPAAYLQLKFSALWEMWGPWPSDGAPFSHRGPVTRAAIGLRFPLLAVALLALWSSRGRIEAWALTLPALVLTVIHTAFFANARFSYPAEPLLAILAVAYVCHVARTATWWRRPQLTVQV